MILLDTKYLIGALVQGAPEARRLLHWMEDQETLCTSAVVWYEFLCGPIDRDGVALMQSILQDRVIPFTAEQAVESARLYNACGRQRRLRVDAMIASAAIVADASLATSNIEDFRLFTGYGLRLTIEERRHP